MTAATCCAACGYDPSAVVSATWSFFVALDSKSLNGHVVNAGSSRHAYRRHRDHWTLLLRNQSRLAGVTKVVGFRRVTLTRCYAGRQQLREFDNLVGGYKVVVDALVAAGVLVDDSADCAQVIYKQSRQVPSGIRFLVEELTDAT